MRSERKEAKIIIVFKTSQHRPRNEHRLIINASWLCTVVIRGGHVGQGGEGTCRVYRPVVFAYSVLACADRAILKLPLHICIVVPSPLWFTEACKRRFTCKGNKLPD